MEQQATAKDLVQILSLHSGELQKTLGIADLREVQFSLPTDGAGLRIRAAVRDAAKAHFPPQVDFWLRGKKIVVPIELSDDFQDYEPY